MILLVLIKTYVFVLFCFFVQLEPALKVWVDKSSSEGNSVASNFEVIQRFSKPAACWYYLSKWSRLSVPVSLARTNL